MQVIVDMSPLDAMVRKKHVTHGMFSTFLPSVPPLRRYLLLVQFVQSALAIFRAFRP